MRDLTQSEQNTFTQGKCPFCGGTEITEGPGGGASQNLFCANEECGAGFNIAIAFGTMIQAELIREPKIRRK
jgi:hypothetical protein